MSYFRIGISFLNKSLATIQYNESCYEIIVSVTNCESDLPVTDVDVCWVSKKIDVAIAAPIITPMSKPSKAKDNLLQPVFRLDN